MKPEFLIGAANSGAGKTTFTIGLLRILADRGKKVRPFKCGPDYIDTRFHEAAAGNPSVNLDTWLSSPEHVRKIYSHYSAGMDCCVTEGVMGLFDGYDRMKGSSGEIAALLDLPVVLVVNAAAAAYSVAAMIHGFSTFSPGVKVAGAVFNHVSSPAHYAYLKDACIDIGVEAFGYIPEDAALRIPSRHLGLEYAGTQEMEALAARIAPVVAGHVEVDRLLEYCMRNHVPSEDSFPERTSSADGGPVIAVACDEAFAFTYQVNMDRLAQWGRVVRFSPLRNEELPPADAVYLPGGYPELYAGQLSENRRTALSLKKFAEKGGRIFAECGGMMYLTQSLTAQDGREYEMAGVLPLRSTMLGAGLTLGYRRAAVPGLEMRGHEFHYSHTVCPEALGSAVQQYSARNRKVPVPLYRYKNVIAGYTHWYWGETDFMDFWNRII